ncbi:DUF1918 domain-containing protein [Yinghuangia sp. YIM S09857]|uniref:DUF1918 domain-containing protein n=1 Tax=Yinghuangia sp. YIM S09857 TaxID=3436929 RepID=UPI003F52B522
MNAEVGNWIVVESVHLGGARRIGRVMAVQHTDGSPPYLVKWTDNDRETLFFPGPEAHVETTEAVMRTGR